MGSYLTPLLWRTQLLTIEEGYFEYGNFKFENGEIEKQSGELKAMWGTKS